MHLPANSSPHSSRWPVSGRRRPGARAAAAGSRPEPVPTPTSDCATAVAEWSAQLLRDSLCRSGRSASAWVSANSAWVLHPLAARLHGPPARVRFRGRKVIRLGSVRRSGQTQYRVRGLRQPAFRPLRSDRRGEGLVSSPAGLGQYASPGRGGLRRHVLVRRHRHRLHIRARKSPARSPERPTPARTPRVDQQPSEAQDNSQGGGAVPQTPETGVRSQASATFLAISTPA